MYNNDDYNKYGTSAGKYEGVTKNNNSSRNQFFNIAENYDNEIAEPEIINLAKKCQNKKFDSEDVNGSIVSILESLGLPKGTYTLSKEETKGEKNTNTWYKLIIKPVEDEIHPYDIFFKAFKNSYIIKKSKSEIFTKDNKRGSGILNKIFCKSAALRQTQEVNITIKDAKKFFNSAKEFVLTQAEEAEIQFNLELAKMKKEIKLINNGR